jgi:hypothetical protein
MSLTKRIAAGFILAVLAWAASPAAAQVGSAPGRRVYGVGPRLGENLQLALQQQDRLGLSSAQVEQLRELQSGVERVVTPLEQEIDQFRSSIGSGGVSYARGQARLLELLAEFEAAAEPYRIGVSEVLTPDQHATLQRMMYDTRPYGRGWAGAGYGRVARGTALGGRGFGRGAGYGAGWGFRRSIR